MDRNDLIPPSPSALMVSIVQLTVQVYSKSKSTYSETNVVLESSLTVLFVEVWFPSLHKNLQQMCIFASVHTHEKYLFTVSP